jgi:threonine/homoserine/homoserine lactone efflux protein
MAWDVWLTFIGAAILIAVSPGAGAVQSMATGLRHGFRRGYWSILGLEVGLMLQLTLVAWGLYTGLAVRLVRWLHTPRQQTVVNRVFSGLFATAAVVLSLVRRAAATG